MKKNVKIDLKISFIGIQFDKSISVVRIFCPILIYLNVPYDRIEVLRLGRIKMQLD